MNCFSFEKAAKNPSNYVGLIYTMKCYVTNNSPYARKVRVVAFEIGLHDQIDCAADVYMRYRELMLHIKINTVSK